MAQTQLLEALKVGFKETSNKGDFPVDDIDSLLISDTIIIWSFKEDPEIIPMFVFIYHFLSCRLAKLGLPLRGTLSRGSLLVRKEVPHIIVGSAILDCASIEPNLNAFVVAVHRSVIEYLNDCEQTKETLEIQGFFSNQEISMKKEMITMPVIGYHMPYVAETILLSYKLLIDRLRTKDDLVFPELKAFIPKFLNTANMIDTLMVGVDDRERVVELWKVAIDHAQNMLKALNSNEAK